MLRSPSSRLLTAALVLTASGPLRGDIAATAPEPPPVHRFEPTAPGLDPFLGARIQRTMTLLATSDVGYRPEIRILCYGQSIIEQGHVPRALRRLFAERYPRARVEIRNAAIGSYEAHLLVRTAAQDIAPWYPDLVILHVYSSATGIELERIISDIRRRTTAEIVLWTHHFDNYGKDGRDRDLGRDRESNLIRRLAQQYNCELVELREAWRAELGETGPDGRDARKTFLADNIHLAPAGGELLAREVLRHFRFNPLAPSWWADQVRSYEARRPLEEATDEIRLDAGWTRRGVAAGTSQAGAALRLRFEGNRVVAWLPALEEQTGTLRVLVNGKPPSAFPEAYFVTRVGGCGVGWYPVINRILPGGEPVEESWRLEFFEVSPDGARYRYRVVGTVSGADGEGDEKLEEFVSRSGRLRFLRSDITLGMTARVHKKPLPAEFTLTCDTRLLGADTVRNPSGKGVEGAQVVLVQGLANTAHEIALVPVGDGPVAVERLVVHRPPLR